MALALQCKFYGHIISIDKALAIRDGAAADQRFSLPFQCVRCGAPVRPRVAGDKHVAHFVHIKANPVCSVTETAREF